MNRIFSICLCFTLLFSSIVIANEINIEQLPSPYNEVALMPYNPHGWYGNHEPLSALIKKYNVNTIVEVGSWMGMSTIDLAQMLPSDGKVYAVDTWAGSPNETHDPQILATLYDQFLSNMIHCNLTEKVIPVRMTSLEAAAILSITPELVYIDATHEYEPCLADLRAWYPFIRGHGVICGDDWAWGTRGVEKAVVQFAAENNLKIQTHHGWFWWLE